MFKRSKKTVPRSRLLRERANMSFFIVIMFFAVFGVIVLTEIFLIDERGRGAGVLVRHGHGGGGRHQSFGDRPDYEDGQALLQSEELEDGVRPWPVFKVPSLHAPAGSEEQPRWKLVVRPLAAEADDYLIYRGAGFDENIGVFIREDRGARHKAGEALQPLQLDALKAIPEAQVGAPGPGGVPAGVESRLPPISANLTAKDGSWQIVSGTRYKFFVFSAFYDRREERSVRVVGATKTRGPERVWCRLWYNGGAGNGNVTVPPHSISVAAKVKVIRENWNLKYSACFILCPLGKNLSAPNSVSIVSRLRMPPANHILVRNTDQDPELRNMSSGVPDRLAICVKPLHFNYNQALQMLEFLELNAILGVHHFTLYNHTVGPAVGCILRDYMARGVVTLLPWKLNMVSQKEIRTEGLFAALNDCLYRSMYRYSHTALVDLDEYIIPRHNDTLPQLIKWMGTRMNTRSTGSYSFQNAFFYLQWGDDPAIAKSDHLEGGLVTLRKTRRRTKLHPHKQRSKYLCRPEFVVEAGNHFVWEFVPGHGTLNVPPDAAILHHYRVCEFGGDDCIKTASVVDQTAYRYRERLTQQVRMKWNELKAQCDLPDLTAPSQTLPNTTSNPNITKSKLKQKPLTKYS